MSKLTINGSGWIESVEATHSTNFDSRPPNSKIKLIVVHGISLPPAEFGGGYIHQFFCNSLDADAHEYFSTICQLRVSAHCLIERDGNISQFVSFLDRAWHAGESSWRGEQSCNNFSVGVELEGTDDQDYTEAQYCQLGRLVIALRLQYPDIEGDAICGHSDIAPGRKTDPGPMFDWRQLHQLLEAT